MRHNRKDSDIKNNYTYIIKLGYGMNKMYIKKGHHLSIYKQIERRGGGVNLVKILINKNWLN